MLDASNPPMDGRPNPNLAEADILLRLPLWSAFSDLFLDTDVTLFYSHIARTVQASPFTREQAWHILWREVTPAFAPNLSLVTGTWDGWDEPYVRRAILTRLAATRWFGRLAAPPQKGFSFNYALGHWNAILPLLPPEKP